MSDALLVTIVILSLTASVGLIIAATYKLTRAFLIRQRIGFRLKPAERWKFTAVKELGGPGLKFSAVVKTNIDCQPHLTTQGVFDYACKYSTKEYAKN